MEAYSSILEAVGNTPIVPLTQLVPKGSAMVYAKDEAANPSFSLKDRIALSLVEQAKKKKKVEIVVATAGNTGVALSMVCVVQKIKLTLFMPENASIERRKMFEGFGAGLVLTPKEEGVKGAQKRAQAYASSHTNACLINQFDNEDVVRAHQETTAHEILADFPEGVDALVLGVGTGGSLTGVGRVLKKKFPRTKIYAIEPTASAVLSGGKQGLHRIEQIGLGFIPANLDQTLIDEVIQVEDVDAYQTTRALSQKAGILVGISSGANVWASLKIASQMDENKKILTFLCDAGQRYFSIEKYFKQ
ncbi:MAG TPA: cysteine synthase A [Deltaproteobacteria bacterium]|nr:MAG: hypothetical protein A2048_09450 [Deltaproteobacteria bacterium GWA2_45_12]HBF12675.1 cysteine synthase A [Deltaproteobacteria bacterium]